MKYVEHDLGVRQSGERVRVTLKGDAANVQLLDSSSRSSYQRGGRYQYIGGHYTQSPVVLTVPRPGHWYVMIDHGGNAGHTESGVQIG